MKWLCAQQSYLYFFILWHNILIMCLRCYICVYPNIQEIPSVLYVKHSKKDNHLVIKSRLGYLIHKFYSYLQIAALHAVCSFCPGNFAANKQITFQGQLNESLKTIIQNQLNFIVFSPTLRVFAVRGLGFAGSKIIHMQSWINI